MSIKCLVCGHQNADGATICINCGTPLEAQQSVNVEDDGGEATMLLNPGSLPKQSDAPRSSPMGPKLAKPQAPPPTAPPPPPEPTPTSPPPPPPEPPSSQIPSGPLPPAGRPPAPPDVEEEERSDAPEPEVKKAPPPKEHPGEKVPPKNYSDPVEAAEINEIEEDPPASLGKRVGAALIDGVVAVILLGILSFFVMSDQFFEKDLIGMLLDLRVSIALWILAMTIYFGFMTSTSGGQTIGKKALGIRVINAEGFEEVNIGMALARGLLKAVGYALPPIGILLLLPAAIGVQKRGLHDLMTGTRVVEEE
ncbi:MAG: RDD family protein [Candidatus Sumerlaeia bacterium]|nr:RDD family protein [Candidatus Sumerlaeia bacterium]